MSATINGEALQGHLDLNDPRERHAILYGGENFVLLFTVSKPKEEEVNALISKGFPLQKVGIVTPQSEDLVLRYQSDSTPLLPKGWDAFGS